MEDRKNILKWFNGTLEGEALEEFKRTKDFLDLQPIMEGASALKMPDFEPENALLGLKALRKSKPRTKSPRPWRAVSALAASFLALISLYYIWNNRDTTIDTPYAQTASVQLPDASQVIVNAGSTLSFNKNKWDRTRAVNLRGEAFFKVSKGRKFTVFTQEGTISVLGTQFNVSQRGPWFEVSCYSGKVAVEIQGEEFILTSGKSIALREGQIGGITDFKGSAPDWMQDKSTFDNIPFPEVIAELERQYAIRVEVDKDLLRKNFTGSFVHNDLEAALNSICFPINLEYKITNKDTVRLYAKK